MKGVQAFSVHSRHPGKLKLEPRTTPTRKNRSVKVGNFTIEGDESWSHNGLAAWLLSA